MSLNVSLQAVGHQENEVKGQVLVTNEGFARWIFGRGKWLEVIGRTRQNTYPKHIRDGGSPRRKLDIRKSRCGAWSFREAWRSPLKEVRQANARVFRRGRWHAGNEGSSWWARIDLERVGLSSSMLSDFKRMASIGVIWTHIPNPFIERRCDGDYVLPCTCSDTSLHRMVPAWKSKVALTSSVYNRTIEAEGVPQR